MIHKGVYKFKLICFVNYKIDMILYLLELRDKMTIYSIQRTLNVHLCAILKGSSKMENCLNFHLLLKTQLCIQS